MKTFQKFFENKEVVESINFEIFHHDTMDEVMDKEKKFKNRHITFTDVDKNERTEKVKEVRIMLATEDYYLEILNDNDEWIEIDVEFPIKILGKRIIDESDPYGEEDWD